MTRSDYRAAPRLALRPLYLGTAAGVFLLVGALGGWAATAQISGAVLGRGDVALSAHPQYIQSSSGGVVREIAVRNGEHVEAGDLLLRLDDTTVRASLGIAQERLAQALALRARLRAENLGLAAPDFTYAGLPVVLPDTGAAEELQASIFAARADVLASGRMRLAESRAGKEAQIRGLEAQMQALRTQRDLLDADRVRLDALDRSGLARANEVSTLAREIAQLEGEAGAVEAQIAALRVSIQDAELAVEQQERAFREGVVAELQRAQSTVEELVLEIVSRQADLERMELRSPSAGRVHELGVTTVGGVAAPGEILAQVLPVDQGLNFRVRIDPRDIDRVHPGQGAEILVSSLDPRTTPRMKATVQDVSAGAIEDPRTGIAHYEATLVLQEGEIDRISGESILVPGMPVDAFLEIGERTVLEYLLRPAVANLRGAFREE